MNTSLQLAEEITDRFDLTQACHDLQNTDSNAVISGLRSRGW